MQASSKPISLQNLIKYIQDLITKINNELQGEMDRSVHDESKEDDRVSGGYTVRRSSQTEKVRNNLGQIKEALEKLAKFEQEFQGKMQDHINNINELLKKFKEIASSSSSSSAKDAVEKKLGEINKELSKLKHRIPARSKASIAATAAPSDHHGLFGTQETAGPLSALDSCLSLHVSKSFSSSSFHREIKDIFGSLKEEQKKCLMCFAVFPENEELMKRMLTYWWAGEGFLQTNTSSGVANGEEETIEEIAGKIFKTFEANRLIQPVYKKRSPVVRSFRMQPAVRSVIVDLSSKEKFFSYDDRGKLVVKMSPYGKACLVKSDSLSKKEQENGSMKPTAAEKSSSSSNKKDKENSSRKAQTVVAQQEEKLETIFNVDEPFPDLSLKSWARATEKSLTVDEWLSKKKALRVLYLGTWQASGAHHVEIESTDFLKGLKNMSNLRLFSLQGIFQITELTDSIKGLKELKILDLKACHNLEKLPKEISYLQNLTHLDVSDCFMMDHMPRGLSSLTKLQVLKGFVLGDHQSTKFCTLEALAEMKSLRKLSVIISKKNFPTENELKALENLQKLKKLTLSWGADSTPLKTPSGTTASTSSSTETNDAVEKSRSSQTIIGKVIKRTTMMKPRQLPKSLEKLDLQCYPLEKVPDWLAPEMLKSLKNLYIRGGRLGEDLGRNFSSSSGVWSSVETLRLKFLASFKLDWDEMLRLFPSLTYLEKVDCPLITLCPCDEDGVWVKDKHFDNLQLENKDAVEKSDHDHVPPEMSKQSDNQKDHVKPDQRKKIQKSYSIKSDQKPKQSDDHQQLEKQTAAAQSDQEKPQKSE